MGIEKMFNVSFSKEEIDILILQVGARIDYFKEKQIEAGKNENIKRVIEIENGLKPLLSGLKKLESERYK